MKIITTGTLPDMWWVGRRGTCNACGAVFELEAGDSVTKHVTAGGELIVRRIRVACPTCGRPVDMGRNDRPNAERA